MSARPPSGSLDTCARPKPEPAAHVEPWVEALADFAPSDEDCVAPDGHYTEVPHLFLDDYLAHEGFSTEQALLLMQMWRGFTFRGEGEYRPSLDSLGAKLGWKGEAASTRGRHPNQVRTCIDALVARQLIARPADRKLGFNIPNQFFVGDQLWADLERTGTWRGKRVLRGRTVEYEELPRKLTSKSRLTNHFVQTPNAVFDAIAPNVPTGVAVVMFVVLRETLGKIDLSREPYGAAPSFRTSFEELGKLLGKGYHTARRWVSWATRYGFLCARNADRPGEHYVSLGPHYWHVVKTGHLASQFAADFATDEAAYPSYTEDQRLKNANMKTNAKKRQLEPDVRELLETFALYYERGTGGEFIPRQKDIANARRIVERVKGVWSPEQVVRQFVGWPVEWRAGGEDFTFDVFYRTVPAMLSKRDIDRREELEQLRKTLEWAMSMGTPERATEMIEHLKRPNSRWHKYASPDEIEKHIQTLTDWVAEYPHRWQKMLDEIQHRGASAENVERDSMAKTKNDQ